jgi:hypothetical protein
VKSSRAARAPKPTTGSGGARTGEAGAADTAGTGQIVDGGSAGTTSGTDTGGNSSELYVRDPGGCALSADEDGWKRFTRYSAALLVQS